MGANLSKSETGWVFVCVRQTTSDTSFICDGFAPLTTVRVEYLSQMLHNMEW